MFLKNSAGKNDFTRRPVRPQASNGDRSAIPFGLKIVVNGVLGRLSEVGSLTTNEACQLTPADSVSKNIASTFASVMPAGSGHKHTVTMIAAPRNWAVATAVFLNC